MKQEEGTNAATLQQKSVERKEGRSPLSWRQKGRDRERGVLCVCVRACVCVCV